MSKKEEFRKLRIFNSHGLVESAHRAGVAPPVWLSWRASESGRAYTPAGYYVRSKTGETFPDAPWYDHGDKFFGKEFSADFETDAKDWASEKFGVEQWSKIEGFPRDWFPKEIADYAKQLLFESRTA